MVEQNSELPKLVAFSPPAPEIASDMLEQFPPECRAEVGFKLRIIHECDLTSMEAAIIRGRCFAEMKDRLKKDYPKFCVASGRGKRSIQDDVRAFKLLGDHFELIKKQPVRFANLLMRKQFPQDLLREVLNRLKNRRPVDQNEVRRRYEAAKSNKKRACESATVQQENQVRGVPDVSREAQLQHSLPEQSRTVANRAVVNLILECCRARQEELARLVEAADPEGVGRMLFRRCNAEDIESYTYE